MTATGAEGLFWPGSLSRRGFDAVLRAAVAGEFGHMALSPWMVAELLASGRTADDIAAEARDHSVFVSHLDGVTCWAPIRFPSDADSFTRTLLDFESEQVLDFASALGMQAVLAAGAFDRGALPLDVMVRSFCDFCDAAFTRNLRVDLEFVALWGIPDLPLAWEIVRQGSRPNSGILVDTWHLIRGTRNLAGDIALLRSLPPGCVQNVQLADATLRPKDGGLLVDLFTRTFPGDGELPIAEMISAANASGSVKWIGTEVFGPAIDTLSDEEAGKRNRDSLRAFPLKI